MNLKSRLPLLAALLLPAAIAGGAGEEPAAVPVYEEPRHRLVFEKANVRVFSTRIPPGDMSLFHSHRNPTFYVIISIAQMRNQDLGGDWTTIGPPPGPPPGPYLFRDYRAQPQTHRVENIDGHSFEVIGVINYGGGSEAAVGSQAGAPPELENRWFSAWRFLLEPGAETAVHRHDGPVLVVQVGGGNSVVLEHGRTTAEKTVAGAWSWHHPDVTHRLANVGDTGVELMEVEIR